MKNSITFLCIYLLNLLRHIIVVVFWVRETKYFGGSESFDVLLLRKYNSKRITWELLKRLAPICLNNFLFLAYFNGQHQ